MQRSERPRQLGLLKYHAERLSRGSCRPARTPLLGGLGGHVRGGGPSRSDNSRYVLTNPRQPQAHVNDTGHSSPRTFRYPARADLPALPRRMVSLVNINEPLRLRDSSSESAVNP